MKITIEGVTAEGKTALARAIRDLCVEHGITVTVSDSDFNSQGEETATRFSDANALFFLRRVNPDEPIDPTAVALKHRLEAIGKRGTRIEIVTVAMGRCRD